MTIQDVYKDFIDNDKKILKACFDADKDLADAIQVAMTKQISAIWYALIEKGIINQEEIDGYYKKIDEVNKEEKKEDEKQ